MDSIHGNCLEGANPALRALRRPGSGGKDQRRIVTAVGRELLGFIWAIGMKAEAAGKLRMAA